MCLNVTTFGQDLAPRCRNTRLPAMVRIAVSLLPRIQTQPKNITWSFHVSAWHKRALEVVGLDSCDVESTFPPLTFLNL